MGEHSMSMLLLCASLVCVVSGSELTPEVRNATTRFDVDEAILKGLEYLYRQALADDTHFAKYGHDYLMCIDGVIERSTNPLIVHRAEDIARAVARKWKGLFSEVPEDVNAAELSHLMFGLFALERIGLPFRTLKNQLREAMPHFETMEYLHFDPLDEAPGADFPLPKSNPMHKHINTAEIVWYNALVHAYVAQKLRLPLGHHRIQYKDIITHITSLRPYKHITNNTNHIHAIDLLYALTNLVWTLSDYGKLRLDRNVLEMEFAWFRDHLKPYLALNDETAVAIVIDCLKLFGEGVDDDAHEHSLALFASPLIEGEDSNIVKSGKEKSRNAFGHMNKDMEAALQYLLARQNPNGSWGQSDVAEQDRYHPTCACLYALCEHSHDGYGPSIPGIHKFFKDEL